MPAKKKSGRKPDASGYTPNPGFEMPEDEPKQANPSDGKDADLLAEIRADYKHFKDYWRENREQMEICMRFAAGDAFDSKDHAVRETVDLPCETPDELSQYVKQTNNNLRQNKRDVQFAPTDELASGEDAEKKLSVYRGLNHRGNFQAAFQTAFECCTWCGFGFFGISLKKNSDGILEPSPRQIENQFSVLLDPYVKEADYSDQKKCFVLDIMRQTDFAREYKNAQKRSFTLDDKSIAGDWVIGDEIVIAEAWRVEDDGIYQYITNGLEILDKIKWIGKWIPVIPILGEKIHVNEGGRIKRKYLSLIHRARTPQKMLAYLASQELMEFAQSPRAPFIGYEGQFTDPNWATVNVKPVPFLQVKAISDPLDPQKTLPLPQRPQYLPQAQAYEVAREAWRRGVQSAMGIVPLPTAAQRQNEKSGIALDKIQTQEATGSYHFLDNASRALVNYGRQMEELIEKGMTHGRHVGIKKKDDSHGVLYLLKKGEQAPAGVDPKDILQMGGSPMDVTFTVGPSSDSQREEASDFVDTLLQNLKALPIPPPVAQKILSLAIKLKNVGPLGDEMAKMLDPQEGTPEEQMQKMEAAAAQQGQVIQELKSELSQLRLEKQGKVVEGQWKSQIEAMNASLDKFKILIDSYTKQAVAEIMTKAQSADVRTEIDADEKAMAHEAAHELALQKDQQAHESNMADKQADIASMQSTQDAQQNQDAAAQQAALNPPEPAE